MPDPIAIRPWPDTRLDVAYPPPPQPSLPEWPHDEHPSDPVQEADLRRHPQDTARWSAYAQWLIDHRDPRGWPLTWSLAAESEANLAARAELEARIDAWRRLHRGASFEWRDRRSRLHYTTRYGWLEAVALTADDATLRDLLAHPATAFLRAIWLNADSTVSQLSELPGLGERQIAVTRAASDNDMPTAFWPSLPGAVHVVDVQGTRRCSLHIEDGPWFEHGSAKYLARITVSRGDRRQVMVYGQDHLDMLVSWDETSAFCETFPLPDERVELEAAMRITFGPDAATEDYALRLSLKGSGSVRVAWEKRAASGPPFEAVTFDRPDLPAGPALVSSLADAVVPRFGVVSGRLLVREAPEPAVALPLPPSEQLAYATGGPAGWLACSTTRGGGRHEGRIWLVNVGDGTTIHVADDDHMYGAWFAAGGETACVYSAHRGAVRLWLARLGTRVVLGPVGLGFAGASAFSGAVFLDAQTLWIYDRFWLRSFDLDAAAEREPIARPVLDSSYNCFAYEPSLDRLAWGLPMAWTDRPGLSAVGWTDDPSAQAVIHHRLVPDGNLDNVAVLPDGRILATGRERWLIDPARQAPLRIGPEVAEPEVGYTPRHLSRPITATREPDGWRLWSRAAGAWWFGLPRADGRATASSR